MVHHKRYHHIGNEPISDLVTYAITAMQIYMNAETTIATIEANCRSGFTHQN